LSFFAATAIVSISRQQRVRLLLLNLTRCRDEIANQQQDIKKEQKKTKPENRQEVKRHKYTLYKYK
jgi:hypothetical protein